MEDININDILESKKKKTKKAVTLYLTEEVFDSVKNYFQNESISSIVDSFLSKLNEGIKKIEETKNTQQNKQGEKESDTQKGD